ncbi:hypothetical protein AMJ39_00370 [candidate division TA06 bacterium DG_24]|uniref:FlgD/Vpr Ig-like domain-containing protein n=3 Tax=Bacteria division TA06 TaxID=1156500 RepID=A0A0S8G7H6_UNCT6|nr:MAG: hypothetical protein AMJ39_00370 [candidate division TA06 bacterium DG_24]KPK68854.1 MAG: hypothetical protein AMJ82_07210 [candidate division TA06 bacterium SM23_40]
MAFVLALLVPLTAAAQITFERTYGGASSDLGRSVAQTPDGGYIVAGTTRSYGAGQSDLWLIKTDAWGSTSWSTTFGGPQTDGGRSVALTLDGGYIIAGNTTSFGEGQTDIYLVRTDADGHTVWTRPYGGPQTETGRSVAPTLDGGFVVTGYTESYGAELSDVVLIKVDANGDTVWTRTYGGSSYDSGESVAQTLDEGYIVAGGTTTFGAGSWDIYVIKTDSLGDTMWTRTYGGPNYEGGFSVAQTSDGGYIIVGETESYGAGDRDVYLVKTDGVGDTIWTRTYGGPYADGGYSVAQTNDGGYIITGYGEPFPTGIEDLYLIRTDSAGDTLWTRAYAGLAWDGGYSVAQTLDGGYIVVGYTWPPGDVEDDVYLIKTDADGMVGVSEGEDELPAVAQYLAQNRPNPFGSSTTICYSLSAGTPVKVAVYDIRGALVRTLAQETVPAGFHSVVWDGRDQRGRKVASGIYFCRLETGEFTDTKRMALLR